MFNFPSGSVFMKRFQFFSSTFRLMSGLLLVIFILVSCKKDNTEPLKTNEITLSSQIFGTQPYYSKGYSFEKQEFINRISSGSDIDIYLNEMLNAQGELIGVQFTTNIIGESTFGYYLNEESENLQEAETFYINYREAVFPEYESLTDTIKPFQVYTFKTWKSNYVKFFVKDVRVVKSSDIADFIEVDIKYFIQRDGDDTFSE